MVKNFIWEINILLLGVKKEQKNVSISKRLLKKLTANNIFEDMFHARIPKNPMKNT